MSKIFNKDKNKGLYSDLKIQLHKEWSTSGLGNYCLQAKYSLPFVSYGPWAKNAFYFYF